MKCKSAVIALLLLACSAYAATHTLTSHVVTAGQGGSTSLFISNCDLQNGPNRQPTKIFIENPLSQMMSVHYQYRDLPSGTWKSGGKLCDIPASQFLQCDTTLLIVKGGTGNGTFEEPLIHLVGTSDAAPGDTYEADLPYSVTHFTGSTEGRFITQLGERSSEFTQAQSQCTANPACCDQTSRDAIDAADQAIQRGNAAILVCNLTQAYENIMLAETKTDNATARISTCLASAPSPTPAGTPSGTQTPAATQTPHQSPAATGTPAATATPAPTAAPRSGGICPLGLALMLGGLGLLLLRR